MNDEIIRDTRAQQQRRLFLAVWLAASLSMVLLAFEWKSHDPVKLIELGQLDVQFEALQEIPITEAPPKPPKIINRPL